MKMTFQPKKRSRAKVHGFRAKNEHERRKKSFSCQKIKRKKTVISIKQQDRSYCGLFFSYKESI